MMSLLLCHFQCSWAPYLPAPTARSLRLLEVDGDYRVVLDGYCDIKLLCVSAEY